jgi:hypothetical protein
MPKATQLNSFNKWVREGAMPYLKTFEILSILVRVTEHTEE